MTILRKNQFPGLTDKWPRRFAAIRRRVSLWLNPPPPAPPRREIRNPHICPSCKNTDTESLRGMKSPSAFVPDFSTSGGGCDDTVNRYTCPACGAWWTHRTTRP